MHRLRPPAPGQAPFPDPCLVCSSLLYQFIFYAPLPEELECRLREAFAGESQAYVRNLSYAQRAFGEGLPPGGPALQGRGPGRKNPRRQVVEVSGGSCRHLRRAFENEIKVKQETYPALVKEASTWAAT